MKQIEDLVGRKVYIEIEGYEQKTVNCEVIDAFIDCHYFEENGGLICVLVNLSPVEDYPCDLEIDFFSGVDLSEIRKSN